MFRKTSDLEVLTTTVRRRPTSPNSPLFSSSVEWDPKTRGLVLSLTFLRQTHSFLLVWIGSDHSSRRLSQFTVQDPLLLSLQISNDHLKRSCAKRRTTRTLGGSDLPHFVSAYQVLCVSIRYLLRLPEFSSSLVFSLHSQFTTNI